MSISAEYQISLKRLFGLLNIKNTLDSRSTFLMPSEKSKESDEINAAYDAMNKSLGEAIAAESSFLIAAWQRLKQAPSQG